jgi:hypothetical protein
MPTNHRESPLDDPHSLVAGRERLHPAWLALIRLCERLQFGELERIRIQDGLPMTAEVIREKVRFGP